MKKFLQKILDPSGDSALKKFHDLTAQVTARRKAGEAIFAKVAALEAAVTAAESKMIQSLAAEDFDAYSTALARWKQADAAMLRSHHGINTWDELTKTDNAKNVLIGALNTVLTRLQRERDAVSGKIRATLDGANLEGIANHPLQEIESRIAKINEGIGWVQNQIDTDSGNSSFWSRYAGLITE